MFAKNTFILLAALWFWTLPSVGQRHWASDAESYNYFMDVYASLQTGKGERVKDLANYEVAAFAGRKCLGTSEVQNINGKEVMHIKVGSYWEEGENVFFRYYDRAHDEEYDVEGTSMRFTAGKQLGSATAPYALNVYAYYQVEASTADASAGEVSFEDGSYVEGTRLVASAMPHKGYRFEKWNDGNEEANRLIEVDRDLKLTAMFSIIKHTLTFELDDNIFATREVAVGEPIDASETPEKAGFTFSGWQGVPETMPDYDVTVRGWYEAAEYTLTFKLGDEIVEETRVPCGERIKEPISLPEEEGTAFRGWGTHPIFMPAHDVTITGTLETLRHTLTYKVEGEVFATVELAYGARITPLDKIVHEGQTFHGWDGLPEVMPNHDVEATGYFTDTDNANGWVRIETDPGITEEPSSARQDKRAEAALSAEEKKAEAARQEAQKKAEAAQKAIEKKRQAAEKKVEAARQEAERKAAKKKREEQSAKDRSAEAQDTEETAPAPVAKATRPVVPDTITHVEYIYYYSVSYMNGNLVLREDTVRVNDQLPPSPEAPKMAGNIFIGWNEPQQMPERNLWLNPTFERVDDKMVKKEKSVTTKRNHRNKRVPYDDGSETTRA